MSTPGRASDGGQAETSARDVVCRLRELANPANVAGMARYGISSRGTLGVTMPVLRAMAREIGRNHRLASELWDTDIHEARILASLIGDPDALTLQQADEWVDAVDSWDVCDQLCGNLLRKTPFAYDRAVTWCAAEAQFTRRAGFVLMAQLAVHDRKATDEDLLRFLPLIRDGAADERHFVHKAANWALRQIGKRNRRLNEAAIGLADDLVHTETRSARWAGRDALRELRSDAVQARIDGRP